MYIDTEGNKALIKLFKIIFFYKLLNVFYDVANFCYFYSLKFISFHLKAYFFFCFPFFFLRNKS